MLQAKRLGHGSPGRVWRIAVAAGQHLARPDADPHLERCSPLARPAPPQRRQPLPHLIRGGHGSEGVVLVHGGNAEDGRHGAAERALDGRAAALERRKELVEPACGHPPQRLRIELDAGGDEIAGEDA